MPRLHPTRKYLSPLMRMSTWQTDGVVWALEYVDGVVYAGGRFDSIRPPGSPEGTNEIPRANFAAFNAVTGEPLSCAPSFAHSSGASATVRALKASPDGSRLYVGGFFDRVGGLSAASFGAIDLGSCQPSPGFHRALMSGNVRSIDATDSAIVVGGDFTTADSVYRPRYAVLDTSGYVLPASSVLDEVVFAVRVDPNRGRVYVGGDFKNVDGQAAQGLVALDLDTGNLAQSFPGWITLTSRVKGIDMDDSQMYVAVEGRGFGVFDGRLSFRRSDGGLVWRDDCLGATQDVLPVGDVLVGAHHAHECMFTPGGWTEDGFRQYLTAQSTATSEILHWFPDTDEGLNEGLGPRAVVRAGDIVWVGGEFTEVNYSAQQGLVRFGPGQDVGVTYAPALRLDSYEAGRVLIRWKSAWDRDDRDLVYVLYRDGQQIASQTGSGAREWARPLMSYVDTVQPGQSVSYRMRVVEADGDITGPLGPSYSLTAAGVNTPYPAEVLGDEPSLYWRLDDLETENAQARGTSFVRARVWDASGNSLGGTAEGGFTLGTAGALVDDPNASMRFDGSLARVSSGFANDPNGALDAPASFSSEIWFNTTSQTGGKLIGFGNVRTAFWDRSEPGAAPVLIQPYSTVYDRHVYMNNAGNVLLGVQRNTSTSSRLVIRSSATYNDGQWHHAVATLGSTGTRLYVDGELVASDANTAAMDYSGYWRVGYGNLDGWPWVPSSKGFNGRLDEVAVYPDTLTQAEVARHYIRGLNQLPDEQPPSSPTSVNVSVTAATASVSWGAAADNVAVTGYEVHRSASSGFTPDSSTLVGQTDGSTTTFTERGVPNGTWYYRVIAVDGAGNQSPPSTPATPATVSVTVSQVLTLTPSADAVVNASAPVTNYGPITWLAARDTPTYQSFLRYDLPAVPGQDVGEAVLRVRTLNDTSAGSTDRQIVSRSTGTWAENTVTWNTRPDTGAALGDLASTTQPGTWYEIPLDPTQLTQMLGTSPTLTLTGTGTDSFKITSRETATPPELILTMVSSGPPDTEPPAAPDQVTTDVTNDDVTVSWGAAADNVAVTGYEVHRSASSGFTPDSSTLVGQTDGSTTTFTERGVPNGTWYYRVIAVDGAGNQSPPSTPATPATVSPPAPDTEPPAAPDQVTTDVTNDDVTVSWGAAADNVAVTGYEVHRSASSGFTPDSSTLVGQTDGSTTTFTERGVPNGTWYYRVIAVDGAGNQSPPSTPATPATVSVTVSQVLTLTPSADAVVNASAPVTNYGPITWLAARDTPTYQSFLRYDLPAVPGQDVGEAVLRVRTLNDTSAGSTDRQIVSRSTGTWAENTVTWNTRPDTGAALGDLASTTQPGTWYEIPLDPTQLTQMLGTSPTLTLTGTGTDSFKITSRETATPPELILTMVSSGPPDTEPPAAPDQVTTDVTNDDVTVSWGAAADNVAVTGYEVHRSASSGFTPDSSTLVGQTDGSTTTFTERGVPNGTWYYRVIAVDGAGNQSPPSTPATPATVSVTVSQVLTLTPSADAVVNASAPVTNYGPITWLAARDTPTYQSFLRYDLPAVPGQDVGEAVLRVRTLNDTSAGSTDRQIVSRSTGTWAENTVTWNTRPDTGAALGDLASTTQPGTWYEIPLDPTQLTQMLGTSPTLTLTGTGTDSFKITSRETATPPELILTMVSSG